MHVLAFNSEDCIHWFEDLTGANTTDLDQDSARTDCSPITGVEHDFCWLNRHDAASLWFTYGNEISRSTDNFHSASTDQQEHK